MITREEIANKAKGWIEKGFKVIAPVNCEGLVLLKSLSGEERIEFDHILTTNTVKDFLMPRKERILAFKSGKVLDLEGYHLEERDQRLTIILGTRPCDASGLRLVDRILLPTDERYRLRREGTLLVTIGCSTCDQACFCTSLGYGPHDTTGSDIMLLPSKGKFVVRVVSEVGSQFAQLLGFEPDDLETVDSPPTLVRKIDVSGIKQVLDRNFDSDVWKDISKNCISCAACYYLCPTCHCFDIVDESGVSRGIRTRVWDCCSFDCFTRMATHQPRRGKHARYRQRIMHKFSYTLDTIGLIACVGDGRCIRVCPVGVDLIEVLERIGER